MTETTPGEVDSLGRSSQ